MIKTIFALEEDEKTIFSVSCNLWGNYLIGASYRAVILEVTNKRVGCCYGIKGGIPKDYVFQIPLKDVAEAANCCVGVVPIFPVGVKIVTTDGQKYKFTMLGRKKLINAIESNK